MLNVNMFSRMPDTPFKCDQSAFYQLVPLRRGLAAHQFTLDPTDEESKQEKMGGSHSIGRRGRPASTFFTHLSFVLSHLFATNVNEALLTI